MPSDLVDHRRQTRFVRNLRSEHPKLQNFEFESSESGFNFKYRRRSLSTTFAYKLPINHDRSATWNGRDGNTSDFGTWCLRWCCWRRRFGFDNGRRPWRVVPVWCARACVGAFCFVGRRCGAGARVLIRFDICGFNGCDNGLSDLSLLGLSRNRFTGLNLCCWSHHNWFIGLCVLLLRR